MKRPAFQFYPGDWQRDAALRSCSISARGLWIEMMCIMHQSEPYGHLILNGKPMETGQLARIVGITERDTVRWLGELESSGVFSRDISGAVFSRRMVSDERLRNVRAESGRLGGNPNLVGVKVNQNQTNELNQLNQQDKQTLTPSVAVAVAVSPSTAQQQKTTEAATPPGLDLSAWDRWLEYRKQIKKTLKPASILAAQKKLVAFGSDQAAVVDEAIANGWIGFFALKTNGTVNHSGPKTLDDYRRNLEKTDDERNRALDGNATRVD